MHAVDSLSLSLPAQCQRDIRPRHFVFRPGVIYQSRFLHSSLHESITMMESEIFASDSCFEEHTIFSASSSQDADEESRDGLPEIPVEVVMDKHKVIRQCTTEQKELMFGFIRENPEMVTHSSTPESERDLWEDLTKQLNDLKPEKNQQNWKMVWNRWQVSVFKRSEEKLRVLDIKLKKFLTQLKSDSDGKMTTSCRKPKKRVSVDQIENVLKDIEKEKCNLHLELDENEINIMKLKSIIKQLEKDNSYKFKRMKKLNDRKMHLNLKRNKILETETETIEILQKQLMDVEKELAEDEP